MQYIAKQYQVTGQQWMHAHTHIHTHTQRQAHMYTYNFYVLSFCYLWLWPSGVLSTQCTNFLDAKFKDIWALVKSEFVSLISFSTYIHSVTDCLDTFGYQISEQLKCLQLTLCLISRGHVIIQQITTTADNVNVHASMCTLSHLLCHFRPAEAP